MIDIIFFILMWIVWLLLFVCAIALLALVPFIILVGIRALNELAICIQLHRDLKIKGYRSISLLNTLSIHKQIGDSVKQIPPWEHIAVIPGYKECDTKTLYEIFRLLCSYL